MTDHRWQHDPGADLWRCTAPPPFTSVNLGCHGCGATVTLAEFEALRDLGLGTSATLNQAAWEKGEDRPRG